MTVHACGYPTKGKLAAGTLDRNAPMHTATRRCLSVCASISQKTRRVCLICRVTATDSFWVYCTLSFSLVAKLRTMTVSGTPANWLDEELRRRCLPFPPLFSLLSVLHFCSPMRFSPPSVPSLLTLLTSPRSRLRSATSSCPSATEA